ncbi:MAG: carboxypeptidase M32 [Candidatus Marinamargulisbacteria bacterium]
MKKINAIHRHLKKIDTLRQVASVLSWDQETHLPSGAIRARADQLEALSGMIHDHWQSPDLKDQLARYMDLNTGKVTQNMPDDTAAFLRETHTAWKRQTALSKPLVTALTHATSTAQHAWANAREANDFSQFAPHLQELIRLTHQKINELGHDQHPYDTLIDEFEPDMTVHQLDAILIPLKNDTIAFLKTHESSPRPTILGPFDPDNQRTYSTELMTQMGYDTTRGRLDISTHPFTIDIHPTDVRITTRINPDDLMESVSSTIHEVGHGLYEQGLDPDWAGTPYGAARSMAIHESQSRLWEIFIGQSHAFWKGQIQRIHQLFPSTKSADASDFYSQCRHVTPHWCRVASDIVTYNLHIMIRYECEKALFSKALSVNDLPEFWRQKMIEYLGITIDNDAQGVLQDVHWSAGLFGYFPSYTLGTLMASELFKRLEIEFSTLHHMIERHEFEPIKQWLNDHIHCHGSKYTTSELLQQLNISYNPTQFLTNLGY